ncbi:cytochrome P450 [Vitiosangium sp. GDMCC 1.1324]|uniref:cytochrome P450 n=1 Tax=Vitiosangium sp. (strain GDMCC 1.1324) TaxID=2138576 RepID=UPI000D38DBF6|nr:cytochrome P450 [Vitiosangium sp. GDMCC 1.1324]PTL82035.1 cytochrome P450 [Vitiosangium sp. GDMCC 1.1324]
MSRSGSTAVNPPTRALPPKVSGLPLAGALPGLLKDPFDFLVTAQRRHGDVFTVDLGFSDAVILCHPRHAQHVLVDHMRNYAKKGAIWESFRTFMGNGLPASEGALWKQQRRLIQPAFHHQRLVALTRTMVEAVDESLERWWAPAARTGEPFDIAQAFSHMALNVLVRTIFGGELGAGEAERVGQAAVDIMNYVLLGMVTKSLPEWVPFPGRARYRESLRYLDESTDRVIKRGQQGAGEDNLLSLLLHAVDEETGERMSPAQLRDEVAALFVAGHETTAVGLAWAFHLLTRHPEHAQRLWTEVEGVLGQRVPGFADLRQLTHTRNVLQEALRLYSPAFWVPRESVEEDEIDGYRIPGGKTVAVFMHLFHHHPGLWEEPERFDPDRFTPERSEGRHKLAWLPFGVGQRQCIGKEFSMMEGQLILARIAQRYQVEAVPGRKVQVRLGTTLRAQGGVWVHLKAR